MEVLIVDSIDQYAGRQEQREDISAACAVVRDKFLDCTSLYGWSSSGWRQRVLRTKVLNMPAIYLTVTHSSQSRNCS